MIDRDDDELELRREPLDAEVSRRLIAALDEELAQLYQEPGATHFELDEEDVAGDRGVFLVAYQGEQPVGCGALRRHDRDTVELKRMYVVPHARGRGLGGRILAALERHARELGARDIVLETGDRQPDALQLYRRRGFVPIPAFGKYVDSPLSVCMRKSLDE